MNPTPDPDDELDALLRAAIPPLGDDGFSARVVARLPAARRRDRSRGWLAAAGAALGVVIAIAGGASGAAVRVGVSDIQRSFAEVCALAVDPWVPFTLVVIAASLIYTLRRREAGPSFR